MAKYWIPIKTYVQVKNGFDCYTVAAVNWKLTRNLFTIGEKKIHWKFMWMVEVESVFKKSSTKLKWIYGSEKKRFTII